MSTTPLEDALAHFRKYSDMREGFLVSPPVPLSPLAEYHLACALAYVIDHLKALELERRSRRVP